MIQFTVSAPGSMSLFGELVVRYGKSSVMAGIDLRTTLTFIELSEDIVQLTFSQVNLFLSIPLQTFVEFYHDCERDMTLLHQHVLQFINSNPHFYSAENQKIILQVFFYLLVYIINVEKIKITSFRVELSTKLMTDPDLVYLIPSTVCFAACFLHWSRLQNGAHTTFNYNDFQSIRIYAAKCGEICSKIDTASVIVCTYGSVIKYKYTESCATINWFPQPRCEILLVDSGHTVDLETQMLRLDIVVSSHVRAANSIFNKIEFATTMASKALERLGTLCNRNDESNIEVQRLKILLEHHMLMTFIDMNQRLLQLLNLSHYCLDEICLTAQKHGMYGKYTDIHNGRYAYIWCPDVSQTRITFLTQALMAQNFRVIATSLTDCGVKIDTDK